MTEQKKSAAPATLTETGQNAKIELNERQLGEVAGGLTFNGAPLANKADSLAHKAESQAAIFGLKL